jgi:hypothetical protein
MGPRAPPAPLLWAHPRYWAAAAHGAVPAARRDKKTSAAGGSGDGTLSALSKHFGAIYGGRWPGLWAAMQARTRHVAWVTPFEPAAAAAAAVDGWAPAFPAAPGVPACTPPAAARQRAAGTQEQWGCSGGGGGSGVGSGGGGAEVCAPAVDGWPGPHGRSEASREPMDSCGDAGEAVEEGPRRAPLPAPSAAAAHAALELFAPLLLW